MREKKVNHITPEEFLNRINGKEYEIKSSRLSGLHVILSGKDVPLSFRTDTMEDIIARADGSFRVSYGAEVESFIFRELRKQ